MAESTGSDPMAVARHELDQLRDQLDVLARQVSTVQRRFEALLAHQKTENDARARIAAIPAAKLLSDAIQLDGRASERLRIRRRTVGARIERPFAQFMGVTSCVTAAGDVSDLWGRLLAFEQHSDGTLRGFPATVLDVPSASISAVDGRDLKVTLASSAAGTPHALPVVAVPRFAYHYAARKARNFGHWLLDCVPQVVAMRLLAPSATFLVPAPVRSFHQSTLAMAGVEASQIHEWDGSELHAERVLVLESDGRAGGGRPLSSLIDMRQLFGGEATVVRRDGRRIFVSRSDAKAKRQWISNEAEVEELFRRHGFEVVSMAGRSLEEQRVMFSEAAVVAGSSGAGLADIVFAPRGVHVIVLVSDSLVRWYAEEEGTRSLWAGAERGRGKDLAALGDSPRFYAHLAAAFEQVCHTFVGPDEMPLGELSGFLDLVLQRVESSWTH